ncbi:hypothetical protein CDAR_124311 [Caerostris darwini]|uniref:Uncharacterized protein n=1 Tax=Caerostris darwini TaxID=1538125 RepID=A0AAV4VSP9_9ARAC|nr:hypothetical protein CDAR_124311 [Caerostris darwini]
MNPITSLLLPQVKLVTPSLFFTTPFARESLPSESWVFSSVTLVFCASACGKRNTRGRNCQSQQEKKNIHIYYFFPFSLCLSFLVFISHSGQEFFGYCLGFVCIAVTVAGRTCVVPLGERASLNLSVEAWRSVRLALPAP